MMVITVLSFGVLLSRSNINGYGLFVAIIIPFITNYILKRDDNSKIYIFTNIYILINILFIFLTIFQANKLGYINGIFKGNVDGVLYYDAATYYDNTLYISNLNLIDFVKLFFYNINSGNKFYNIFILYNTIICKILGNEVATLILVKLNFTIITMYTIDKIAKKINFQNTLIPIILFSFYPGVIQSNISLLRDNIILFLLVSIIHNYLNIKNKENMKLNIFNLIINGIFLCLFRFYTLVTCIISLGIFSQSKNIKKLFKKAILLVIFILLIAVISNKLGYGFFGVGYIEKYMNQMTLPQAIVQTIIRIIVGYRIGFETISNGLIPNILSVASPIYIVIINLILSFKIFFRFRIDDNILKYLNFYILFAFLNGMLMVLRDGIIVDRIYIMWLWIPCLLISNTKKIKIRL